MSVSPMTPPTTSVAEEAFAEELLREAYLPKDGKPGEREKIPDETKTGLVGDSTERVPGDPGT